MSSIGAIPGTTSFSTRGFSDPAVAFLTSNATRVKAEIDGMRILGTAGSAPLQWAAAMYDLLTCSKQPLQPALLRLFKKAMGYTVAKLGNDSGSAMTNNPRLLLRDATVVVEIFNPALRIDLGRTHLDIITVEEAARDYFNRVWRMSWEAAGVMIPLPKPKGEAATNPAAAAQASTPAPAPAPASDLLTPFLTIVTLFLPGGKHHKQSIDLARFIESLSNPKPIDHSLDGDEFYKGLLVAVAEAKMPVYGERETSLLADGKKSVTTAAFRVSVQAATAVITKVLEIVKTQIYVETQLFLIQKAAKAIITALQDKNWSKSKIKQAMAKANELVGAGPMAGVKNNQEFNAQVPMFQKAIAALAKKIGEEGGIEDEDEEDKEDDRRFYKDKTQRRLKIAEETVTVMAKKGGFMYGLLGLFKNVTDAAVASATATANGAAGAKRKRGGNVALSSGSATIAALLTAALRGGFQKSAAHARLKEIQAKVAGLNLKAPALVDAQLAAAKLLGFSDKTRDALHNISKYISGDFFEIGDIMKKMVMVTARELKGGSNGVGGGVDWQQTLRLATPNPHSYLTHKG